MPPAFLISHPPLRPGPVVLVARDEAKKRGLIIVVQTAIVLEMISEHYNNKIPFIVSTHLCVFYFPFRAA